MSGDPVPGIYPMRVSFLGDGPDLINPVPNPPPVSDPHPVYVPPGVEVGQYADPRVERLARRLCEVEGSPPDVLVTDHLAAHGPKNMLMMPPAASVRPAWKLYAHEAIAALEMFDAGELEKPA